MRKRWAAVAALGAVGVVGAVLAGALGLGTRSSERANEVKKGNELASYALGVEMARTVRRLSQDLDADAAAQGFTDLLSGRELRMSERDLGDAMSAVRKELASRRAQAARADADDRKKQARAFLEENARRKGVVSLPSGVQYEIMQAGHGTAPTDADTVECHYRGALADGTVFEDSRARGQAATVQVGKAIPGLREALKLMPVGSRWKVFVPPELAYGDRGAGPKIGAHATIVFDLELLAVKGANTAESRAVAPTVRPASGSLPGAKKRP